MKLYIKYFDGKIIDHPMLEENLRQVKPQFNPDNLPSDLRAFEQVAAPLPGPYARVESIYHLYEDNVVRPMHTLIDYTAEERAAKIAIEQAAIHPNGWIFDEEICGWIAPTAPPTDGFAYVWSNEEENWVRVTI
jgi:hypothetical protein